jgi:hypothetical protein
VSYIGHRHIAPSLRTHQHLNHKRL